MTNCRIIHRGQHLYRHNATEIVYVNTDYPEIKNVKQALDSVLGGGVEPVDNASLEYNVLSDSPYAVSDEGNAFINVDTTNGPVTINLPPLTNKRTFTIIDSAYKADINNITVNPDGSDTVENSTSLTIQDAGVVVTIRANDTVNDWKII